MDVLLAERYSHICDDEDDGRYDEILDGVIDEVKFDSPLFVTLMCFDRKNILSTEMIRLVCSFLPALTRPYLPIECLVQFVHLRERSACVNLSDTSRMRRETVGIIDGMLMRLGRSEGYTDPGYDEMFFFMIDIRNEMCDLSRSFFESAHKLEVFGNAVCSGDNNFSGRYFAERDQHMGGECDWGVLEDSIRMETAELYSWGQYLEPPESLMEIYYDNCSVETRGVLHSFELYKECILEVNASTSIAKFLTDPTSTTPFPRDSSFTGRNENFTWVFDFVRNWIVVL